MHCRSFPRRYTEGALTRFAADRLLPLFAAALMPVLCFSAPAKKPPQETPWQVAEAARAQLASIPAAQRTPADYRTVMDAYRLIYHADPSDLHAPEAILNVGNLLAEEGVVLHDPHALQASMGQYEFLRKQYPTSSLRITALLEEAHVAVAGMHDNKLAREKYNAFVEQFPHSVHIAEARSALAALRAGTVPQLTSGPLATSIASTTEVVPAVVTATTTSRIAAAGSLQRSAASASDGVAGTAVAPAERSEASLLASERKASPSDTAEQDRVTAARDTPPAAISGGSTHPGAAKALVSGIRHWSTPTYTRVAIDLGDEVQYEAARVPHPDRIYFDLHGTRLASELIGKTFDVVDDGFLKRIRAAQFSGDITRVVLDVNDVTEYSAFLLPNPYRLIIDIHGGARATQTGAPVPLPRSPVPSQDHVEAAASRKAAAAGSSAAGSRDLATLSQQPGKVDATSAPTSQPIAVVADHSSGAEEETPATAKKVKRVRDAAGSTADVSAQRTAAPTTAGQRSLMRALGLKIGRIVIDPGHGGHDSGTVGAGGIMEKDVVLDVALRLGKLLHDHLGAEIIYTRSDDTFIPLETRTAIANKAEADLFLSIHANSSHDETTRGIETYYLNFTSDATALDVAARENAVSDQSVSELSSMVKKITLKDKIDESREFAQDVEASLYDGLQKGNTGLKNRGVKKAPFVVLIGANMPSILTEISFVTNPQDASQLRTGDYRQRVAESIYRGVSRYAQGLGGMRLASTASTKAEKSTQP